ncbi:MAG: mobile mystery protein A, partial [Planctomycetes bacterium]|nr:mobile mystery protein A [Planctomycetota bacterium]
YKSLIYRYARQRGLNSADAEEIVSACFEKLSQVMAEFEYRPTRGKFKSWLRQLASHKISHLLAKQGRAELLPNSELDLHCSAANDAVWERTWQREVLTYCVQQARVEVSTRNYSVFQLSVYDDWTAREIAQALGMSTRQLAKRLGITQQAVTDLERRERDGRVTIDALTKTARAMGAELVYAIVPATELEEMIRKRARAMAQRRIGRVAHSMELEDQGTSAEERERQVAALTADLIASGRNLWNEVE